MRVPHLNPCCLMKTWLGVKIGFQGATAIQLIDRQGPWVVQLS